MLTFRPLIAITLFGVCNLLNSAAHAQTAARVYMENAKTWGAGDTLFMFGLPVKNADGKASYWDVQIKLEAAADTGKPSSANLTSVIKSPSIKKAEFVPGTYKIGSDVCEVQASPFIGRNRYDLRCPHSGSDYLVITWYTGSIAGHPFEGALRAAGLDLIPGSDQLSWGRVMLVQSNPWGGCSMGTGNLVSAHQVGDVLTISNYGSDDQINCPANFIRSPV